MYFQQLWKKTFLDSLRRFRKAMRLFLCILPTNKPWQNSQYRPILIVKSSRRVSHLIDTYWHFRFTILLTDVESESEQGRGWLKIKDLLIRPNHFAPHSHIVTAPQSISSEAELFEPGDGKQDWTGRPNLIGWGGGGVDSPRWMPNKIFWFVWICGPHIMSEWELAKY